MKLNNEIKNFINKEIKKYNATIVFIEMKEMKSFTLRENNHYYIVVNENLKNYEYLNWIIMHELEHIKKKAFYTSSSSSFEIAQKEIIVNDALVLDSGLYEIVLNDYESKEIGRITNETKKSTCNLFKVPSEIYDHTVNFINRKRLILYDKITRYLYS